MISAPMSANCPAAKPSRRVKTRPPTRSRASSTTTSWPAACTSVAATSPDRPAPTTTTFTGFALSLLDEELAGTVREDLVARLGDTKRIAELEAPAFHPHPEHEMERHVRFHHGRVVLAKACRVVRPVRRIVHADRIPDARRLAEAGPIYCLAPRQLHVLAKRTRLHGRERCGHPFGGRVSHPPHLVGRLAEVNGPWHRAVVPTPAAAQL